MEQVRQAVVLCAGAGLRMGQKYKDTQKCTLSLFGKPIIVQLVEKIIASRVEEVVLLTGHKAEQVEACFLGHFFKNKLHFIYCHRASLKPLNILEMLAEAASFLKPPLLCVHSNILFKQLALNNLLEAFDAFSPLAIISIASQLLPGVTHYRVIHDEKMNVVKLLDSGENLPLYMGLDIFSLDFLRIAAENNSPWLKQLIDKRLIEQGMMKASLYRDSWFHLATEGDLITAGY